MKRREFLAASATLAGGMLPMGARSQTAPCPPGTFSMNGGQTVVSNCGTTSSGTAPQWFVDQAPGTWSKIAGASGQRIGDVLPGYQPWTSAGSASTIITSWTGGSVNQGRRELLLVANGGHADYSGNEAYGLQLGEATPRWRRLTDPTTSAQIGTVDSSGRPVDNVSVAAYGDGRPRAMHTFQVPQFVDGRVWFAYQNSYSSGPGSSCMGIWSFDREALYSRHGNSTLAYSASDPFPWVSHGAAKVSNGYTFNFPATAYDSVNKVIWVLPGQWNGNVIYGVSVAPATLGATINVTAADAIPNLSAWAVVAPDLQIMIAGVYRDQSMTSPLQDIWVFNLGSAPGFSSRIGSGQSTGYYHTRIPAPNMDWDPNNFWQGTYTRVELGQYAPGLGAAYRQRCHSVFLGDVGVLGGTIRKLQIPTKVVGGVTVYDPAGTWAFSSVTPTSGVTAFNSVTSGVYQGAYSKFNVVQDMDGTGNGALVCISDYLGPTYVYKLPAEW